MLAAEAELERKAGQVVVAAIDPDTPERLAGCHEVGGCGNVQQLQKIDLAETGSSKRPR